MKRRRLTALETLIPRERQVLTLTAAGHTVKTAAQELGIASETVKDYSRGARLKLGASNTTRAAVLVALLDKQ